MSCDYLFSSFVRSSNDKEAGHAPYAWLRHFLIIKRVECSEQWVQRLLNKFAIPWASAALANCLNLSTVVTVQGLSCLLFRHAFRGSRIHVTLFCNLIGAARIRAPEATVWTPPTLPGSVLQRTLRGNEPGYKARTREQRPGTSLVLDDHHGIHSSQQ